MILMAALAVKALKLWIFGSLAVLALLFAVAAIEGLFKGNGKGGMV